jgi:hypothetical protein
MNALSSGPRIASIYDRRHIQARLSAHSHDLQRSIQRRGI